jgi:hypothetical protein
MSSFVFVSLRNMSFQITLSGGVGFEDCEVFFIHEYMVLFGIE